MNTPICDFVRRYADSQTLRLHMPGHKGTGPLGIEHLDITEISGADSLYEASGIIAESEANASYLFGCPTFYSTEGSSQCIRAMLHLATLGRNRRIAAARNVHKTFLSAAALLDLQVDWLYPDEEGSYLACHITAEALEDYFAGCTEIPAAVYVTSPDYLGNMLSIGALAAVCHRHGSLLLVDNAHGAYLRFLPNSRFPMDLGADLCCDSAHKTLPVLTGGAYLHIRDKELARQAKNALALFGSTSPSYLILQSLDAANATLADPAYIRQLVELTFAVGNLRMQLAAHGINASQEYEPLKITIYPQTYGYTGIAFAEELRNHGIECEFADPNFLVLMLTPANTAEDLRQVAGVLTAMPRKKWISNIPPQIGRPERVLSIREALLSPAETVPVEESLGRVLASPSVGCPPAVPIVVCGERIDEYAISVFRYYGIRECSVIL